MKRTTTPNYSSENELNMHMMKGENSNSLQPKKQTMDFLMQFARSYHAEVRLPKQISGMILN